MSEHPPELHFADGMLFQLEITGEAEVIRGESKEEDE